MTVAVTKYQTQQVADDKWKYGPVETRVFESSATVADIEAWAKPVSWSDLVLTPVSRETER